MSRSRSSSAAEDATGTATAELPVTSCSRRPHVHVMLAGLVGGRVPAQWTVPLASRPQGPYGPELNATSAAPPIPTRNGVEATVALPSRLPQQYKSPLATRPQA